MNTHNLQKLKQQMEQVEGNILGTKGTEYIVSSEDRLKFFHDYAEQLGVDPKTVCAIFLMKHINSILNYVKTGKDGVEGIKGRINDARNYLLFMEALIEDTKDSDYNTNTVKCMTPKLHFVDKEGRITENTDAYQFGDYTRAEEEARSQDYEDKCRWELNADAPVYGDEETEIIDGDD